MRKDEQGTILIEFVGSFLMFVLLIGAILNLVTVVTVQARMHYALTETAKALSMYGYVLHVTGIDKTLMGVNAGAETVREEANDTIDEINAVFTSINELNLSDFDAGVSNISERVVGWADTATANPKQTLQYLMKYGLNELGNFAFAELVLTPLTKHYLANGDMSGDEYLRSVRVKDDLQFYSFTLPEYTPAEGGDFLGSITGIPANDSILLDQNGDLKITVQYEIEYSFFGLKLPWGDTNPTLKITQSAMTKMWLGGKGDGYTKAD